MTSDRTDGKTVLWRWLRILVSLGLLALLFAMIGIGPIWELVREARPDLVALMVGIYAAQRFFAGYRWYVLLRGKTDQVGFGGVLRLIFLSDFVGFFGPSGVAIEVVRVLGLSRATADTGLAVTSVLVERVLAMVALALLVLLGLLAAPPGLPPEIGMAAAAGLVLLVLGSIAIMSARMRRLGDFLLTASWLARVRRGLARVYQCLDDYRDQPGLLAWSMLLAILFQVLRVAVTIAGALALGADLPLVHYFVIMPAVVFVTLIPISIGGIGVREAAFVSLFGLVGMDAPTALALSLLVSAIRILVALPGAWVLASARPTRA